MNTEHTNQPRQAEPATHSPIALQSIPKRQRGFTAENIRDIAHECMRIGDNEQAEVIFAIADALRDGNLIIQSPAQQQAEPVAAQCRFEGEEWKYCTIAHHLLVQAHPKEWPHYETRALYAQPPAVAGAVPDERAAFEAWLQENIDDTDTARPSKEKVDAYFAVWLARAMLAGAPQAATEGCGACGDGCQGQGCRLELESPPTCQKCNGAGVIRGLLSNGGGSYAEPCPDCTAPEPTAEDSSVVGGAGAAPAEWPTAQDVGRIGDMSKVASLRVGLDADNDVYVSIANEEGMADVEFCVPGSGGGKSPRTRAALISLMVAMEADNAETPSRNWWKARDTAAQKGGAA